MVNDTHTRRRRSIQLKLSVSRTISEPFSVKEWSDLETEGRDRSKSLKMAPSDRIMILIDNMTFYWSAIVNIAILYRF